jgi:predicted TIM-barrel fold metal-dependent hydrolase
MISRRAMLAVAGGAFSGRLARGKAAQPATKVNFAVPAGACDCHTHIFGDPAQFPMIVERTYTPETASPDEMSAMLKALGVERVVIVTPSVYGTDNAATLFGIRKLGRRARGVAVIDSRTSENELDAMGRGGICGIRLNLATAGAASPEEGRRRFEEAAARMAPRRWHVQIYASLAVVAGIRDLVERSPVPVVFDHFGGAQAALGTGQAGFSDLLALVKSGNAYVKISGAYRASTQAPDYPDAAPLAKALIAANPERILWGTDWPHPDTARTPGRKPTDVSPLLQIDDGHLMNQLAVWAPDAPTRRQILRDNPARVYGF